MKRAIHAALLCGALMSSAIGAAPPASAPVAASDTAEYVYRTQARDTLIGIARRLLKDPRQWRALQTLNNVRTPTRMPQGTALRIPRDWLRQQAEAATALSVTGPVSSNGAPVAGNDVLSEGARIQTGEGGRLTLKLTDGSLIDLGPASSLTLEQLRQYTGTGQRDTLLQLDAGRVETKVKPQGDAGRFRIRTPVAVSAVRGTEFRRSIGSDALDRTEVVGGAVAVSAAKTTEPAAGGVQVGAGFGTLSDAGGGPRAPVKLLPPPDLTTVPGDWSADPLRIGFKPVDGAVSYRAQLAADPDFHQVVAETESQTPALHFDALPDAQYWLRVRCVDALGLAGEDAVRSLRRHRLPDAPSLQEPAADAFTRGVSAVFSWNGDAAGYQWQLSQDPSFSALAGAHEGKERTWQQDLAPGEYYWRVAALNAAGERGPWSDPRRLTHKPPPPVLAIGAVVDQSLHLSWPARPGQHFRLQVAHDAAFQRLTSVSVLEDAQATLPAPGPGSYYVRVQATDPDGYVGPWSAPGRFSVPFPWWVKAAPVLLVLPFL